MTAATEKINIASLKAFAHDPQARRVGARLVEARADAARLRVAIDKLCAPLFAAQDFRTAAGERITHEDRLYLVPDLEAAEVKAWDAQRDAAIAAAGYKVKPGYCPALIAADEVRKLEGELLDIAEKYFGVAFGDTHGDLRRKAIQLHLELATHEVV